MTGADYRIEVFPLVDDARGRVLAERMKGRGYPVTSAILCDNYLVHGDLNADEADRVARALTQTVVQGYTVNRPHVPDRFAFAIEIGFLPGVTDNVAHTVRETIGDLLKRDLDPEKSVFSSVTCFIDGDLDRSHAEGVAAELYNPLIQRARVLSRTEYLEQGGMGRNMPLVELHERPGADTVNLDVDPGELTRMAREGIANPDGTRRGPLALDMASMDAIRDYFLNREKRNPTDIELESIAQTWSEHCKHTIFAAGMDDDIPGGLYRTYIREATVRIRREKGRGDFCLSVFTDNAGGIAFDDEYIISDKVETHNSPSALDPFGGSVTGIVGVNRDSIGFGMASKPVANRYGFCFADPRDERPLYRDRRPDAAMLSPRRIMEGVIHGVNVGGNHSGIPTPQGFIYFDERYKGKPLVFVGTIGLLPRTVGGKSSVQKKAMAGDNIVIVGGRVGQDGIHGATFSSEALNSGSPATAVQIGDPITQKKLSDAIVKEARDQGLYHSITDNGAGGLSCSVAEMARECGGFEVDLEKVPLKYPGLSPWQIWISESQERMTLAVPDDTLDEFILLMKRRGVESAVIGRFTDGKRGVVRHGGRVIFDLDMTFLHEGLPAKNLRTSPVTCTLEEPSFPVPSDLDRVFTGMVSRLNTAGFEFISYQYDYEVQGTSVVKPLQGRGRINGNASVIRPVLTSRRGVVLSQGIYPSYSDIDTYHMAACSIDTAIRNAVAAGATLDHLALLDNFCWCDSNNPERLWQLRRAAQACYDIAVAYGTPFISGKDSMFNDFRGFDDSFNPVTISVPPTLLISSIGVVEDIDICQTIDFKVPGDLVYLAGVTRDETGGSEYLAYTGEKTSGESWRGRKVPVVDPSGNAIVYRAVEKAMRAGIVASSLSVERGGLALALARSAMAGMLGFDVNLASAVREGCDRDDTLLYGETQGRILMSVNPAERERFERFFSGLPLAMIGTVTHGTGYTVIGLDGSVIMKGDTDALREAHRSTFISY